MVDWQLPGLSGRDLLVALQSQGYRGPVIVMGSEGSGRTVLEAFRLGATDYIPKPIREAEALAAVDRGLNEVRLRRDRDALIAQLQTANRQLEARINELTTLYNIGQSVAALHDLARLFEHVLDSALSITKADQAILLLRDEKTGQMILQAGKNMPLAMLDRLGEPIRDQVADLVMTSREALTIAGDSLRRFASGRDLSAAVYVPLIVQENALGVLAVGNRQTQAAFDENHARLLKALADYAAIALINVRLFNTLDQRAKALEKAYRDLHERDTQRSQQLQAVREQLLQPLEATGTELARLAQGDVGKLPQPVRDRLTALSQQVKQLAAMVDGLKPRQE
jgi:two-component system NtrC family sensor kinase